MSLVPLRVRAFRHLLFAYAVNQLGDWIAEVGLAVLVFAVTGSPAAVAATWVTHRCAFALLAPVLVARLEHHRADRVLPAIYLIEAGLFGALAITAPIAGLAVVLPLVAADGLLAPTARALARNTLVLLSRPAGMHREANALVNVAFTVNGMLAPAVGGVLVALIGAAGTLGADAASFLVAAGALASCPLPTTRVPGGTEVAGITRVREALRYVTQQPLLRGLLGGDAALTLFVSMITPVEVQFVSDTLHAGSSGLSAVLTTWGVGMIAGGVIAGRLRATPLAALLLSAAAAEGAACLGMGLSGALVPVLVFSALGGIGNGIYAMAIVTAIQERTRDAYQARVNALYDTLMTLVPGIGFAIGGALAALAGPRAAYLLAGTGTLALLTRTARHMRAADWTPGHHLDAAATA